MAHTRPGQGDQQRSSARPRARLSSFSDVAGLPTTSYHQQDGHDLATAGPTVPNVTDENITRLVQRIADVRAAIPPRDLPVIDVNKRDKQKLGYAGGTPTGSYTQLVRLSTTKPTQSASAADVRWLVFRRLAVWEGSPAAVQTWDVQNVTYGAGVRGCLGPVRAADGRRLQAIARCHLGLRRGWSALTAGRRERCVVRGSASVAGTAAQRSGSRPTGIIPE